MTPAPSRRAAPLPPIQPAQSVRLTHPDGTILRDITPDLAKRYLVDLRRFVVAAEPWRPYRPRVKDHADCRCGAETNAPGREGWMYRRITGEYYAAFHRATGFGKRGESLCPRCQQQYRVAA